MTDEELKLEALKYLENFQDCANCRNRWGDCADQLDEYCLENSCRFAIPREQDIYLAGAEPREKRIAELEAENEQIKNSDTLCKLIGEQKIKITELESQNKNLQEMLQATRETRVNADYLKKIAELEAQIEKMKADYDKLLDEKIELEDRLAESRECY